MRLTLFTFAMACALAAPHARADARLDFRSTSTDAPLTRMEISGSRMRMDAGDASVVVDSARKEFVTIDHSGKQYTRFGAADVERLADAASAAKRTAEAFLQNLPPDQREQIESQLGARVSALAPPKSVKLSATGRHEKVAGYDCEVHTLSVDGEHTQDLCLASADAVGLAPADRKGLADAFAYFKNVAGRLSAGVGDVDLPFDRIGSDRVPVKIVDYDGGKPSGESTLTAAATSPVPAADFAPPSGYAEKALELPELGR